jgi:hypothetical protein
MPNPTKLTHRIIGFITSAARRLRLIPQNKQYKMSIYRGGSDYLYHNKRVCLQSIGQAEDPSSGFISVGIITVTNDELAREIAREIEQEDFWIYGGYDH